MCQLRFTENHEWIKVEGNLGIVGITDYAQDEMGDVTFVDVPTIGVLAEQGEFVCVVETVKTSFEVCAAVNGEIAEVNSLLADHPELINSDPMGDGWIYKLKKINRKQVEELMDVREYDDFTSEDFERAEEQSLSHISLDDVEVDDDPDDEDY